MTASASALPVHFGCKNRIVLAICALPFSILFAMRVVLPLSKAWHVVFSEQSRSMANKNSICTVELTNSGVDCSPKPP